MEDPQMSPTSDAGSGARLPFLQVNSQPRPARGPGRGAGSRRPPGLAADGQRQSDTMGECGPSAEWGGAASPAEGRAGGGTGQRRRSHGDRVSADLVRAVGNSSCSPRSGDNATGARATPGRRPRGAPMGGWLGLGHGAAAGGASARSPEGPGRCSVEGPGRCSPEGPGWHPVEGRR